MVTGTGDSNNGNNGNNNSSNNGSNAETRNRNGGVLDSNIGDKPLNKDRANNIDMTLNTCCKAYLILNKRSLIVGQINGYYGDHANGIYSCQLDNNTAAFNTFYSSMTLYVSGYTKRGKQCQRRLAYTSSIVGTTRFRQECIQQGTMIDYNAMIMMLNLRDYLEGPFFNLKFPAAKETIQQTWKAIFYDAGYSIVDVFDLKKSMWVPNSIPYYSEYIDPDTDDFDYLSLKRGGIDNILNNIK